MKKLLPNLKYITLSLILIIASFVFSHSAHADTLPPYNCSNGGTIITTVNITSTPPSTSPYVFGRDFPFITEGQIETQGCIVDNVNLMVHNNSGAPVTLIPTTAIGSSALLPSNLIPATRSFTTPHDAGASYAVHFVLGVDDPGTPTGPGILITSYNANLGYNNSGFRVWEATANIASAATQGGIVIVQFDYTINDSNLGGAVVESGTTTVEVPIYVGEAGGLGLSQNLSEDYNLSFNTSNVCILSASFTINPADMCH